jgi:para-nitrobenzyl esterase
VAPEVETSYGRLRGAEAAGIRIFRGVRFAAPPRGRGRFLPPAPPEPWTGVRDATEVGPAAPQVALPWFSWINGAGLSPGEDCLSLSVWTPGLDGARRPVMVWIHGGGFMVGSGSTPVYDGRDLARRGDLVVVNINYRLGALGYAHLGELPESEFEQSSNLGVRDQIAALEWVRDNIERFGGDPNNVTVFGQSAGAMSIGALLGAPRARALFTRAVCMSGAADHVLERDEARAVAEAFVAELGGLYPSPDVLGRVPLKQILRAQARTMRRTANPQKLMAFLPAVDGDVISEQPLDAIRRGATAHVPLLVGSTLEEWKLFRLFDEGLRGMRESGLLERFAEVLPGDFGRAPSPEVAVEAFRDALGSRSAAGRPGDVWSAFQSARVFHFPAARLSEAQQDGGGSAYAYLFTWRSPSMRRALGACHALDIPFVFGSTGDALVRPLTGLSNAASRLSRLIQHAWIQFARDGAPGHERLPPWPEYERGRRGTMIFGRDCVLDEAPLEAERRLLESWSIPAQEVDAQPASEPVVSKLPARAARA